MLTTDGRIAAQKLRVLEDDRKAFPQYNVAPTVPAEFLARYPQVRGPLETVSRALTNEQMIELCRQVDVEGRDAGVVARDWMLTRGFIRTD